jgi:hypothetical protein
MIRWLVKRFARKPDVIIGSERDPYLLRWHVIPRNPVLNIYLHKFLRSDDDRALHDHPWVSASLLFRGQYVEVRPKERLYPAGRLRAKHHSAPALLFRGGEHPHRISLVPDRKGALQSAWTVFVTGPRYRQWFFYCPFGRRKWQDFTSPSEKTQGRARGCD